MIGAIIGDIVGSRFEFNNHRSTDFELFHKDCFFTDDTVCTVAVADWLLRSNNPNPTFPELSPVLRAWCKKYPGRGYGGMFNQWLIKGIDKPYNSFGNGSAMRVSPVGWAKDSVDDVFDFAEKTAIVTHNHPEGIVGAQTIALAVFLAVRGDSMIEIKETITQAVNYDFSRSVDEIRLTNRFNETCQGTVPEALACFFESTSFEHAIRLAVSIGGDSDTIAAITGSVAEAHYGIPFDLKQKAKQYLPDEIKIVIDNFKSIFPHEGHDL